MPVKTFWMLHRNIDRILAERDMRAVRVMTHSQTSEGVEELLGHLKSEMDRPYVLDEDARHAPPEMELDREGLHALKGLGSLA